VRHVVGLVDSLGHRLELLQGNEALEMGGHGVDGLHDVGRRGADAEAEVMRTSAVSLVPGIAPPHEDGVAGHSHGGRQGGRGRGGEGREDKGRAQRSQGQVTRTRNTKYKNGRNSVEI
jgi:hypothetical protein